MVQLSHLISKALQDKEGIASAGDTHFSHCNQHEHQAWTLKSQSHHQAEDVAKLKENHLSPAQVIVVCWTDGIIELCPVLESDATFIEALVFAGCQWLRCCFAPRMCRWRGHFFFPSLWWSRLISHDGSCSCAVIHWCHAVVEGMEKHCLLIIKWQWTTLAPLLQPQCNAIWMG